MQFTSYFYAYSYFYFAQQAKARSAGMEPLVVRMDRSSSNLRIL